MMRLRVNVDVGGLQKTYAAKRDNCRWLKIAPYCKHRKSKLNDYIYGDKIPIMSIIKRQTQPFLSSVLKVALPLVLFACCLSSCATIVGGSRYLARVTVKGHDDARIIYKGDTMGKGKAVFLVKRKEANKFNITLREPGCNEKQIKYTTRSFRVGACVWSVILWGAEGVGLDFLTGAYWKPDIRKPDIRQVNVKLFEYTVYYDECK